jgi:hypothetical protein
MPAPTIASIAQIIGYSAPIIDFTAQESSSTLRRPCSPAPMTGFATDDRVSGADHRLRRAGNRLFGSELRAAREELRLFAAGAGYFAQVA